MVKLNSQSSVFDFGANYPLCSNLEVDLIISGSDIIDLSPLQGLSSIAGSLIIRDNPLLESLSLSEFGLVVDSVIISGCPKLVDLSGFFLQSAHQLIVEENDSLQSIDLPFFLPANMEFVVKNNPRLLTIGPFDIDAGFDRFHIEGNGELVGFDFFDDGDISIRDITIRNNSSLTSTDGLQYSSFVPGARVVIENNESLVSLPFPVWEPAGDNFAHVLSLQSNPLLKDISSFSYLNRVDSILIVDNSSIVDLSALAPFLADVLYFNVACNSALSRLEFAELHSVGTFVISDNDSLIAYLDPFERLLSVDSLDISSNAGLVDISGFMSVDPEVLVFLNISDNVSLTNCSIRSVCDYLDSGVGFSCIKSNLDDCASGSDVMEACDVMSSLHDQAVNVEVEVFPNPCHNFLYIDVGVDVDFMSYSLLDMGGQEVLTGFSQQIDVSLFEDGCYFMNVITSKGDRIFKVILN